jgi:hypothetical protein
MQVPPSGIPFTFACGQLRFCTNVRFSATGQNLNLKPHGAGNLLSSKEVLLNGMLVCNVICWADGNRRTTRPSLHRKRLKVFGKALGWNARMLGLRTKKSCHVVASLDSEYMRIEACIGKTAIL